MGRLLTCPFFLPSPFFFLPTQFAAEGDEGDGGDVFVMVVVAVPGPAFEHLPFFAA